MQKILIILNAPPYGSERCLSALRLALTLASDEVAHPEVKIFLMSDAAVASLPNQNDGTGKGLQSMIEDLVKAGVTVKVCRTCALARGIAELPLIPGVAIGTMPELAGWTLDADKVITF